jgi:hypothetical protein
LYTLRTRKGFAVNNSALSRQIALQQHPDYHWGFYDALDFTPLHYGMTPEYRSGWIAAHRCKRLFKKWVERAA